MNILFIEDELELANAAVLQLELKGYTVYPVYDLESAREVMLDESRTVHLIIADHSLTDGLGIQFVIEMKEAFPRCQSAIVSGCLTPENISELKEHEIPYYHKPLLYGKVVEELRRSHSLEAPDWTPPVEESEEAVAEPVVEEVAPAKEKKLFGFFRRRKGQE